MTQYCVKFSDGTALVIEARSLYGAFLNLQVNEKERAGARAVSISEWTAEPKNAEQQARVGAASAHTRARAEHYEDEAEELERRAIESESPLPKV